MSTSQESSTRSRDLERMLTFVDAIVAIAVTLLILPLADLAGTIEDGVSVWDTAREHSGKFVAFLLSFVVITRLWLAQHRVMRGARHADGALGSVLLLWSLTIVFLPFPTALLADAGDQAATKVFYIGTLFLSDAMLTLVAFLVSRQLPKDAALQPRTALLLIDAVLFLVALVLCVAVPGLSYYPLLLPFLVGPIKRLVVRSKARDSAPHRP